MKRQLLQLAVDQSVSSLITFTLSVYAARNSSVSEFGVFAVAYALFWVLLGVSRSFVGEVNLIIGHEKLEATGHWRSFSATTALAIGVASGIILFAGCTLIASTDDMWIPWCFAVATPLAVFADAVRYVAFTEEVHGDALTLDAIWLCGALFTPPMIAALGVAPAPSAILGWGLGAGLGTGLALKRRPQLRPRLKGVLKWAPDRRVTGAQFAADFLAGNGIGQIATALVPVVASLAVAGGLRAGYVIMGPLNVAYSAMIVFLIPRIRGSLSSHRVLPSPVPTVWGAFAAFCGLCAAGVLLVPDRLGEFLLGPSWYSGQSVAPVLIVGFIFLTMVQIIVQVMRLRGSAGSVIPVRLFVSGLQSAALLIGAALFGTMGAASGSALAALVSVAPWWFGLTHAHRKFDKDRS